MRKPVLLISPLPPPYGGIATWTQELIQYGLPDGNPLTLVDTKIRSKRNIFDPSKFSFAEISRTFKVIRSLLYQLVIKRPRIVHLSCSLSPLGIFRDFLCAFLVRIFRIPVISHYHGNIPDFRGERAFGLSKIALRALMRISKVNIVENKSSFEKAKSMNKRDIVFVPNFIRDNIFDLEIKNENGRCRAIFAGGITRAKGCAEILTVAKQLPDVDFHLFGKMHDDMKNIFAHAPKNIFLHGIVKHDVLLTEMCKSDFLFFPSYTEGFPLTVLEAMSIGLPVIATRVGAIPEMVENGLGGFLVAPQDVDGLKNAINLLASDTKLKLAMGNYNKKKSYNQYRCSIVIAQLSQIYNQLSG